MPRAKSPRSPKPTTKPVVDNKVLQMPENGNSSSQNGTARNGRSASDLEALIRVRAYELYAERGYVEGFQEEDWLAAEREVLGRHAHSA
ncbi:MAG TPA: DUF2934 domain-containing protein [Candidatus Angelobacter sp.]|nr:DUF2934 domain-containing protein [Candidatus Angelobacter sp.]